MVACLLCSSVPIRDDVKPVAKQRHSPAFMVHFEKIRCALRLIDDELQQMAGLLALDAARASLDHELARHHQAQTIALLGFFEIVRGDEDGGAGVRQPVDHGPESAPRQRIDAGGRLVEEEHARLMHDGRAEGDPLLPSSGQAAG